MADIRKRAATICGVCGDRREMPIAVLKQTRDLECAGCGAKVTVDDFQLSRLLNANDRTPALTVTLKLANEPGVVRNAAGVTPGVARDI
jgi:hypothetical protein